MLKKRKKTATRCSIVIYKKYFQLIQAKRNFRKKTFQSILSRTSSPSIYMSISIE